MSDVDTTGWVLKLWDDSGGEEEHDASIYVDVDDVREDVQGCAEVYCADGDWGDKGASIAVCWQLLDADGDEIDTGTCEVEIAPNHRALIRAAVPRGADHCGDDPDDHSWTREGEGGCTENPGVWATGGTSMEFHAHCRDCGLRRVNRVTGSQRNPGEHDTVSYEWDERGGAEDERV